MSTVIYPANALNTVRLDGAGALQWIPFGPLNTIESHYIVAAVKQHADYWQVTPLGTPFNIDDLSYPNLYLVEESAPIYDYPIRRWTRTYMPVFPSYDTYEDFTMQYPGLAGESSATPIKLGRAYWTTVVASKLTSEFFILGVSNSDRYPSGQTGIRITHPDHIPRLRRLPIVDINGIETTTYEQCMTPRIEVKNGYLCPDAYMDGATPKTWLESDYWAAIDAGDWMVAQDSQIRQVKGPLYERVTRYVPVQ